MTTWKLDIPDVTDDEDLVRHKEDRIRLRAANLGLERRLARARELLNEARVRMPAPCNYYMCNGDGLRECCLSAMIHAFLEATDEGLRWSDVKQAAREP